MAITSKITNEFTVLFTIFSEVGTALRSRPSIRQATSTMLSTGQDRRRVTENAPYLKTNSQFGIYCLKAEVAYA